jgi:hypothetical protein
VLLENIHGDRARVAVYAAARCARDLGPTRLAGILTEVLAAAPKVTARKEAARLLAVTRPEGAVEVLLAAWHRDGQHRDVRVAVVTALRRAWLDDERVWPVLEAAAADDGGERALAESLLAVRPEEIAGRHRGRYMSLVRRLTRHAEPLVAQAAYSALALPSWAVGGSGGDSAGGLRDDLLDDLVEGVTDLGGGPNWRQALMAVVTPAMWTGLPDLLPRIAATLVDAARDDPDAEPLRDLPARQRLERLVGGLCGQADAARRHPEPVLRVAGVLAADPAFVPLAARLHAALAWPGPDFIGRLTAIADLLRDLPVTAGAIDEHLAVYHWEADDVADAVDALTGRGDLAGGLMAAHLAGAVNETAGWPEPWRARIRALRRHPEVEVCHAARAVFTASE